MSTSIAGPVVQVASGVYLDLLRPNPAHIRIADIATSLSKLCRFTGHTRRFYSVAQHSVEVSRLLSVRVNNGSQQWSALVNITDDCPSISGWRADFKIEGIEPDFGMASATFSNGCYIRLTEAK